MLPADAGAFGLGGLDLALRFSTLSDLSRHGEKKVWVVLLDLFVICNAVLCSSSCCSSFVPVYCVKNKFPIKD